jgi:hypothetical protein
MGPSCIHRVDGYEGERFCGGQGAQRDGDLGRNLCDDQKGWLLGSRQHLWRSSAEISLAVPVAGWAMAGLPVGVIRGGGLDPAGSAPATG